mmetsp:Transcript_7755/g.19515  ORF Transcript_7755/g.19515 Transcript_7755/m.19515 type:complete len:329 (+) Transcript_7755:53-1039(+)
MARIQLLRRRTEMALPTVDANISDSIMPRVSASTGQRARSTRRPSVTAPLSGQRIFMPLATERSGPRASMRAQSHGSTASGSSASTGSRTPSDGSSQAGSRRSSLTPVAAVATAAAATVILQQRRPSDASEVPSRKASKATSALLQEINTEMMKDELSDKEEACPKAVLSHKEVDDMFSKMFSNEVWQSGTFEDGTSHWQQKRIACSDDLQVYQQERAASKRTTSKKKTYADMVLDGTALPRTDAQDDEDVESPCSPCTTCTSISSSSFVDQDRSSNVVSSKVSAKSAALNSTMKRLSVKLSALKAMNVMPGAGRAGGMRTSAKVAPE